MLSMCDVNSNKIISDVLYYYILFYKQAKVISVLKCLNVYESNSSVVMAWLDKVERCDMNYIHMEHFMNFLKREDILETPFYYIRCSIIQHIIGFKEYNTIRKRMNYYTSDNKSKSKEGCTDKIVRKIITHKPNPYYYNYRPSNRTFIDYNSTLVEVRKRFGYSSRPTKESQTQLKSAPSLRSLKNKSNSSTTLVISSSNNYRSANNFCVSNKLSSNLSDHFRTVHNNESSIKKSTVVPVIA